MNALVLGFAHSLSSAQALAAQLGLPCDKVGVHRFPDLESLVQVPRSAPTVVLHRSLNDPNAKLIELILAASAARDGGARRVVLVAPYLAYMRQDMAFKPGEAVSQRVIGQLIAAHFDGIVTVDPHLHRVATLAQAVPGIPAIALSAAPVLASAIEAGQDPVIVGPDSESRQWIESIARPLGLDMLLGSKERFGDRKVALSIAGIEKAKGRSAILVDDVISSGETLIAAAGALRKAGAQRIEALATHCLASSEDLARMTASGIARIVSTDSIPGPTCGPTLAPLLADALKSSGLLQT
ncbi:ribose-phosphate diphosphokinase [Novosphingobium sp. PY1]|uniref:ribose-phosphate diphosphokinase n=1 Tax=Novosphingobium sp. PY1 TaxID=1882221 RepID=UPI000BE78DCC|nr:ribose-phosphate diphosphokinase [Novosphingobium sp. PY1]BBA74147.1 ribose-phosphate pyrophosphokinase [Novosphingobium sp. PY1]GFM31384.1 ribose-phosphate pyrophosphokinase [Novosphingobium sp. PY1]